MIIKSVKHLHLYGLLLSFIALTIPLPMLANNISIIFLSVYWLILCISKKIELSNPKELLILILPYAILIIGAFYSTNTHQLTIELTKSLPFLVLPIIIYTIPQKIDSVSFKFILKAFVFGNIMVCLFLMWSILRKLYVETFSMESLWGITHQSLGEMVDMNAIYLALYVALALLIVVYHLLNPTNKKSFQINLSYILTVVLFVFILIFLSSRTVLFGVLIILLILFFYHYYKKKSLIKNSIFLFLFAGLVVLITFSVNPVLKWRTASLFEIQNSNEIQGKEEGIKMRKKLWTSSFELIKDNWLLGVGTGDFKDELEKTYVKNKYRIQYRMKMNSHNQYISYLVSNGIIGLTFFLVYLFYPVIIFYKNKRLLLLLTVLLFMICFTTESHLYTNKGVILIAFFITLFCKYSNDQLAES